VSEQRDRSAPTEPAAEKASAGFSEIEENRAPATRTAHCIAKTGIAHHCIAKSRAIARSKDCCLSK
jgi:hypothetical protein